MNGLPERLPYDHAKFVDRRDEIKLVSDIIEQLIDDGYAERRVVIFHGQRGTGKSWLLQEIRYQWRDNAQVWPVYLDLSRYADRPPDDAVGDLIADVRQQAGAAGGRDLSRLSEALVADVEGANRITLLLLDHVDESPKELLEPLEDHFLAPLANVPHVVSVLTGRGREYTWKSASIRLRSLERDLIPFDRDKTAEQLDRQAPAARPQADAILKISQGFPWSNYLLSLDLDDPQAALTTCADALIGDCLSIPEPPVERWALEALCVLGTFSDEMIPTMLAAYHDDALYLDWRYRQYRELRQSR